MSSKVSWDQLIKQTTVADIVKTKYRGIITIPAGKSLKHALELLEKQNILAAPVVDTVNNKVLGMVDVIDIAGYILSKWRSLYGEDSNIARDEFFETNVEEIINFSRCDFWVTISDNKSVAELIALLTSPKTFGRLHRVGVLDSNGKLYNVASQADVVALAYHNSEGLPLGNETVMSLKLMHPTILHRLDNPAYSTIETLFRNKISGLALVDDQGRLSANFSASDLRGLTQKTFKLFTHSTLQFLAQGTKSEMKPVTTCSLNTTLKEVLNILVSQHIHRVYIADSENRPYGVVTLSDILHSFQYPLPQHK